MASIHLSQNRIHLLRALYLLIFLGNLLTTAPPILFPATTVADSHTVVTSMLGALALLCLLGLKYPTQLLPILLWELLWKSLWIFNFAGRMWLDGGLDEYAAGVAFAVGIGLVVTPLALPWRYLYWQYLRRPAEPWRKTESSAAISEN